MYPPVEWSDKIPNSTFWEWTIQLQIEHEIKKRKWRWIRHTQKEPPKTITLQAIIWKPQGRGELEDPETPDRDTGKDK